MSVILTPKKIVTRAALDGTTLRYVLDKSKQLDIPDAEGQGKSRNFTLASAMRLAICTRLVMHGVQLERAEEMTDWSEKQVKRMSDEKRADGEIFGGSIDNPWLIHVINARYAQVERKKPKGRELFFDDDAWRDFRDRKAVNFFGIHPYELPLVTWSLTYLEFILAKVD